MDGRVGPCTECDLTHFKTADEYWNSSELKKLRSDMLAGIRNPACNLCYEREDLGVWNNRQFLLAQEEELIGIEYPHAIDYSAEPKVQSIYFRFSNICNYMCLDCNWTSSHLIAKEDMKRGVFDDIINPAPANPILYPGDDPNIALNEAKKYAKDLKNISFSGGEPLLHWQSYEILQYMIDNNIKPKIGYFTNLSILKYKTYDLLELWKNFDSIFIQVGFDAMGDGCDYFRKNMDFFGTIDNVKKVNEVTPHVKVRLVVTWTWLNALNAVNMIKWFLKNHPEQKFTFNMVIHDHLDIRNAPEYKRQQIIDAVTPLLDMPELDYVKEMTQGIINAAKEDHSHKWKDSLKWITDIDKHRGRDFRKAFPEHSDIDLSFIDNRIPAILL